MTTAVSPQTAGARKPRLSPVLHSAVALALLVTAAILDVTKPFDKSWSIFYLLPILYAGWTLGGRLELLLVFASGLTVFLAPLVFRPNLLWAGTGIYNRSFGVLLGVVVMLLLRERRRHINALECANDGLEQRVRVRTAALEDTNDRLRREIAERERAEANQERLEAQLRQAQKMEAVGRLAGGVAHDFNNLLTVIIGESGRLLEEVPAESAWHNSIVAIHEAGGRAADVTQQLLAFGRKQLLQPKVLAVNQAIHGVEGLLRRLLPEHIRLSLDLSPAVEPILADPGQFAQMLLNLASNARDAMPDGGEFLIKTAPVVVTADEIANLPDLRPGPHVRLSVSDTGHGMDDVTGRHAFEPFFTTKAVGKGTGLGLASVYGIVRQSRGNIDLASVPAGGTTFTILWPCADHTALPSEAARPPAAQSPRGNETIMLVEDHDQVRAFTATLLRRKGYEVLEARNGQEALTLATGHNARRFDLLITDVIMPEMDGPALVQHLALVRPGLRVLYITGYSRTEAIGGLARPERVLGKPFSAPELLTTVRQILDSAPLGRSDDGSVDLRDS